MIKTGGAFMKIISIITSENKAEMENFQKTGKSF